MLLTSRDYLPHDTPMLLLESVESVTDDRAVCSVTVNERVVLAPFRTRTATCPAGLRWS